MTPYSATLTHEERRARAAAITRELLAGGDPETIAAAWHVSVGYVDKLRLRAGMRRQRRREPSDLTRLIEAAIFGGAPIRDVAAWSGLTVPAVMQIRVRKRQRDREAQRQPAPGPTPASRP